MFPRKLKDKRKEIPWKKMTRAKYSASISPKQNWSSLPRMLGTKF